jgi:hypothetical protein
VGFDFGLYRKSFQSGWQGKSPWAIFLADRAEPVPLTYVYWRLEFAMMIDPQG